MLRRYLPTALLVLAVMVDVSVIPMTGSAWATEYAPLLTLCTVVTFGLLLGRTRGMLYGLIGGLLLDILVGYQFGLMSAVCILTGYLSGFAGRRYQRYVITPVAAPAVCYLLYELVMMVYLYMAGGSLSWPVLRGALIRVVLEVLITQGLYLLYNRILKPSWSRYAGR